MESKTAGLDPAVFFWRNPTEVIDEPQRQLVAEHHWAVLRLPRGMREDLGRLAVLHHPQETCGLLVGRASDSLVEVVRFASARNLNCERARDRYLLDPEEFLRVDRAARRQALEIVGIWHSHPDSPARPSSTDLRLAWAGYSYLIISTTGRAAGDFRSWRLADNLFEEEKLEEEEDTTP